MQTLPASPGLVIDLLPHGVNDSGWTAVQIRRTGDGTAVVVYLPEVPGLIDALARAAAETAALAVLGTQGDGEP